MSGFIFAAMWLLLAAYLFRLGYTTDAFFYAVAPFFAFLGVWALVNELIETDLMAGTYLWIYRGTAALMLILCGIKYILYKKNG